MSRRKGSRALGQFMAAQQHREREARCRRILEHAWPMVAPFWARSPVPPDEALIVIAPAHAFTSPPEGQEADTFCGVINERKRFRMWAESHAPESLTGALDDVAGQGRVPVVMRLDLAADPRAVWAVIGVDLDDLVAASTNAAGGDA